MTSECYVYIVLPGTTQFVTAARFQVSPTRSGEPVGELVYGRRYMERPDAVELDPVELQLKQTRFETARLSGFFGAIRDAMPDAWGRRCLERSVGRPDLDEFDYSLQGPDDRAGALGFGLNVEPPAPRQQFNRIGDLASLQSLAEDVLADRPYRLETGPGSKQVQQPLLASTSLGGARAKAVVEDQDGLWIAKFAHPEDRWNQPRVEHSLLNLAKTCGMDVADSKLATVAGKDVLLVGRFDREKAEAGYRRHRMVSALTLLRSEDTPAARAGWSYLALADEIRRASASPKADLRELFARMCFNALVSNLDDHPRNHAILARSSGWRLSPAYDLTPSSVSATDTRLLAMECGIHGRMAYRENLVSACGRFLLATDDAEKLIATMVRTVRDEWEPSLRRAGASKKDRDAIAGAFVYEGFFNTAAAT
ncbi:MAG TPA: HipA domain-containing protein [Steroidobacteraceae bacterium]|jgi:serine/threonine-protein kinase HipA